MDTSWMRYFANMGGWGLDGGLMNREPLSRAGRTRISKEKRVERKRQRRARRITRLHKKHSKC